MQNLAENREGGSTKVLLTNRICMVLSYVVYDIVYDMVNDIFMIPADFVLETISVDIERIATFVTLPFSPEYFGNFPNCFQKIWEMNPKCRKTSQNSCLYFGKRFLYFPDDYAIMWEIARHPNKS